MKLSKVLVGAIALVTLSIASDVSDAKTALQTAEKAVKDARDDLEMKKDDLDQETESLGEYFNEKNQAQIKYNQILAITAFGAACHGENNVDAQCQFMKQNDIDKVKQELTQAEKIERAQQDKIKKQKEKVSNSKDVLQKAIDAKKEKASKLTKAESAMDDDVELASLETGEDGIPGGVGSFDFDMSDFELDEVGKKRTPEIVQRLRADLLASTKVRLQKIRSWYAKQRQNALKGVYPPAMMKVVRANHAKRIKVARGEIERYKKAVVVRYEEYRALYKARGINQDQWTKVQEWRTRNIEKANKKFSSYRKKIRENYEQVRQRNEERQDKRRTKLDEARENAKKQIREVERSYRKKDDKLRDSLRKRASSDDDLDEEIFGDESI